LYFAIGGDWHFGWVAYEGTGTTSGKILGWAYEDQPLTPILAGDLGGATLIELTSFSAEALPGAIRLAWETESEIDNEGFHLWRADDADGEYVRVTETLIQAEGGPIQGASYAWEDEAVEPGRTYFYKLEAVDIYGESTLHGPVDVLFDGQCFISTAMR